MKYTSRGQGTLFDGAEMIKLKLKERYITQKELAVSVNIHTAKLSEILNGHRRPSKSELQSIAISLDIDMNEWRKQSKYVDMAFPIIGNSFM